MTAPKPEPGDWIRFRKDGRLVVGVVAYVRESKSIQWAWEAETDIGSVPDEYVLEVRRG